MVGWVKKHEEMKEMIKNKERNVVWLKKMGERETLVGPRVFHLSPQNVFTPKRREN